MQAVPNALCLIAFTEIHRDAQAPPVVATGTGVGSGPHVCAGTPSGWLGPCPTLLGDAPRTLAGIDPALANDVTDASPIVRHPDRWKRVQRQPRSW